MRCKYGDPSCPCQDGDACHYEPIDGTATMNVPARFVRTAMSQARAEGYATGLKAAAHEIDAHADASGSRYIRALPINPPLAEAGKESK